MEMDSGVIDTLKIAGSIDLLEYHDPLETEEAIEVDLYKDGDGEVNEVKQTITSTEVEEQKDGVSCSPNQNLSKYPIDNIALETEQKSKDLIDDKDNKEGVDVNKITETIGILLEKHKNGVSCSPNQKQTTCPINQGDKVRKLYLLSIDDIELETGKESEDCVGKSRNIDTIGEQKTFVDVCNIAGEISDDYAVCSRNLQISIDEIEVIHRNSPFHRKRVHFCPNIGLHKIEYTPPTAEEKKYLFYTATDLWQFKIDYLREFSGCKEAASKDHLLDDVKLDDVKDIHGSMRNFWSCYDAFVTGACSCHIFTNLCCGKWQRY